MLDGEFAKWLATLGVGGVLAGFMFYFYRRDAFLSIERWKEQNTLLMQVVRDQTNAMMAMTTSNVQLTSAVGALHRRLDAEGYPQGHRAGGEGG